MSPAGTAVAGRPSWLFFVVFVFVLGRAASAQADAGDPLVGLSPVHGEWFAQGALAFAESYSTATGLGPAFNAESCAACHSMPVPGGGSNVSVTRFGKSDGASFDPLISRGGPLLQSRAIDVACEETVPAEANVVVQRLTTPIFGAGLVESVTDETLAALADPLDRDGDGVSGRVHLVQYPGRPRVGRFGWKAQDATLLSFNADAMASEMGVTNALVPGGPAPGGDGELLAVCEALEGVPDPEDSSASEDGEFSGLVKMTNFSRLLGPPTPATQPRGRGWRQFRRSGCETCHVARLRTGPHTIPALAFVEFRPYSDFLLHDMGSLGDGVVQGAAQETEMRTAPLWGISLRERYLHDGRALTIDEAIEAHDGEAARSVERFRSLPARAREALLDFVGGL